MMEQWIDNGGIRCQEWYEIKEVWITILVIMITVIFLYFKIRGN